MASIHALKRGNNKCGSNEGFQLVSESIHNQKNIF